MMTCICVLGMHRSGTSCLAGIMQHFGVELGTVYTENQHNKKGNRENDRIVNLNESLLLAQKASWHQPAVVQQWTSAQALERDAIIQELSMRGTEHWGFKDTRTLFTLPFWLEGLDAPKFIGTFRHPQRVAQSLLARDNCPLEIGLEIWRQYNAELFKHAQALGFPITDFDQPDDIYLQDVTTKLVALGLDAERANQAREFFEPALRNQTRSKVDEQYLPAEVDNLYKELVKLRDS